MLSLCLCTPELAKVVCAACLWLDLIAVIAAKDTLGFDGTYSLQPDSNGAEENLLTCIVVVR